MAILDATAQEIVSMTRSECARRGGVAAAAAGVGGVRPDNTAVIIAEVVMGSESWNTYKNTAYKSMTGPRKPEGDKAMTKRTKEHKLKLGGSLEGWNLHLDTRWTMDQPLTWLPPNGNMNKAHFGTLGNMISETFYQPKTKNRDKIKTARKTAKKSSTAAEGSDWNGATSVHGTDFFKTKK